MEIQTKEKKGRGKKGKPWGLPLIGPARWPIWLVCRLHLIFLVPVISRLPAQ